MYGLRWLLLQLTTQTCYFLPPQEVFGEMPGIPPRKNRTDHGVASGSDVPHVTVHAHKQVRAHYTTKKHTHKQLKTNTKRWIHKDTNWHISAEILANTHICYSHTNGCYAHFCTIT